MSVLFGILYRLLTVIYLSSKYEENCSCQTTSRPDIIEPDRLPHVEDRERDEDAEGDDLLDDLQLGQREPPVAEPVGRHLDQVFEEGDAPAHQDGDQPVPGAQVPQVRVPGEGHENIGNYQ